MTRAGYFDGARYGNLGLHNEFKVANAEVYLKWNVYSLAPSGNQYIFNNMLNDQGTAPNWIGFALNQVNGTDDFRLIKGSTTSWDIHVLGQVILGENEITFKNDGLSYEGTLNGVPFSGI
jgi:hypothetical protein